MQLAYANRCFVFKGKRLFTALEYVIIRYLVSFYLRGTYHSYHSFRRNHRKNKNACRF